MSLRAGFYLAARWMAREARISLVVAMAPIFVSLVFYSAGWAISGGVASLEKWGYQLIGIGVLTLSEIVINNVVFSTKEWMMRGLLEYAFASPRGGLSAILSFNLALFFLLGSFTTASIAMALFVTFGPINALAYLASFAISMAGLLPTYGISLVVVSALSRTRTIEPLVNFVDASIAMLGGVIYPIALLPHYLQLVSLALPTWAWADSLRKLALWLQMPFRELGALGGYAVYLAIGVFTFSIFSRELKKSGGYHVW